MSSSIFSQKISTYLFDHIGVSFDSLKLKESPIAEWLEDKAKLITTVAMKIIAVGLISFGACIAVASVVYGGLATVVTGIFFAVLGVGCIKGNEWLYKYEDDFFVSKSRSYCENVFKTFKYIDSYSDFNEDLKRSVVRPLNKILEKHSLRKIIEFNLITPSLFIEICDFQMKYASLTEALRFYEQVREEFGRLKNILGKSKVEQYSLPNLSRVLRKFVESMWGISDIEDFLNVFDVKLIYKSKILPKKERKRMKKLVSKYRAADAVFVKSLTNHEEYKMKKKELRLRERQYRKAMEESFDSHPLQIKISEVRNEFMKKVLLLEEGLREELEPVKDEENLFEAAAWYWEETEKNSKLFQEKSASYELEKNKIIDEYKKRLHDLESVYSKNVKEDRKELDSYRKSLAEDYQPLLADLKDELEAYRKMVGESGKEAHKKFREDIELINVDFLRFRLAVISIIGIKDSTLVERL